MHSTQISQEQIETLGKKFPIVLEEGLVYGRTPNDLFKRLKFRITKIGFGTMPLDEWIVETQNEECKPKVYKFLDFNEAVDFYNSLNQS